MPLSHDENRPLLAADWSEEAAGTREARPVHGRLEDDVLPEESTLGRNLGWGSAYIMAISRVIGSGIFAVPGVVLQAAGSVGLALTIWVVGAVIVACGLAVSLEFGCMLPRSGGDKVYLEFAYPRPRYLASVMVAAQAVLLGFTASNCIIFSQYVHFALGRPDGGDATSRKALAVALLSAITLVHGVWYRAGVRIQNFLGWLKVGLVLFMVLAALYVVAVRPAGGGWHPGPDTNADAWGRLWEGSDWSFGTISTSLFKVFYSYAGLSNVNNVLNEVRDPVRTLRSVSVAALVTACLLYLLTNLAYLAVVPIDDIKHSGQMVAALFFERAFGPSVGRRLLPLAVALSAAGNVMVVTFALARLNQEIARAGFLPFSKLLASSKPFNAPMGGLIVHYIPSVLVITLPPSSEVYTFILEVEGYPGQFYALALAVGLLWLRFTRKDIKRPFRAWLPIVVFRIVLALALLTAPFFPPSKPPTSGLWYATYAVVGIGILAFGFLYWLMWTVVLPYYGGYMLEPQDGVLDDGTTVTTLKRVPKAD